MAGGFIQQILSPGGGLMLIPFTRAVICCLFLTTFSVFLIGVARVHMLILSFLSGGMWFALGYFEKAYKNAMHQGTVPDATKSQSGSNNDVATKRTTNARRISKGKRED